MQVVFHLGAHSTDEERLVRGLLRSKQELGAHGVVVPGPGRYRPVLRETLIKLRGAEASADVQDMILDAVMEEDHVGRAVFSNENFICVPSRAVGESGLYPMTARKVGGLCAVFAGHEAEFCIALRNPATLIPALVERCEGMSYADFMGATAPENLRWMPVIQQILDAAPGRRLTVWCNEDTPLIWPEVLRAVSGVPAETAIAGDLDVVATLMPDEAVKRLRAYLDSHPPANVDQRRRVFTAFLDKFARPEELEVEVNLPGWTDDLVAEMTATYDAEVAAIAALPGVSFIAP